MAHQQQFNGTGVYAGGVVAHQVGLVRLEAVEGELVLLGIDGHRLLAELGCRAHDADGDFAAIGDQDLAEGRHVHPMSRTTRCGWGSLDRPPRGTKGYSAEWPIGYPAWHAPRRCGTDQAVELRNSGGRKVAAMSAGTTWRVEWQPPLPGAPGNDAR